MPHYTIETIGIMHSPFKQKFGIPRQPRIIPDITSTIIMRPEYSASEAFKGIETYSHLWLLFLFHKNLKAGWRPTVKPPRLGGKIKMGVFATRSTHRPNGIGQSAVKLKRIYRHDGVTCLDIEGADILNGTPIIDIKPYIGYSDAIPGATSGFAQEKPPATKNITFSETALKKLDYLKVSHPQLQRLITEILILDPRPAYRQTNQDNHTYGIELYQFNIKWRLTENNIEVFNIETT